MTSIPSQCCGVPSGLIREAILPPGLVTGDEIPRAIRDFDGRRAAVSGYVMPIRMQARGVTEFLLVRDQLSCCFGLSPEMNHWIHVTMPRSELRSNIFQIITVQGTLRVGELRKATTK